MITTRLRGVLSTVTMSAVAAALLVVPASAAHADDDSLHYVYGPAFVGGQGTGRVGAVGVTARFYRETDNPTTPWTLAATSVVGDVDGDDEVSDAEVIDNGGAYFQARLPAGTYRVTFNEIEDGGNATMIYGPAAWSDSDEATEFTVVDRDLSLSESFLPPLGPQVTLKLSDRCSAGFRGLLEIYRADGATSGAPQLRYFNGSRSNETVHTFPGPTKIRVRSEAGGIASQWIGGDSFATAKTFTGAKGDVLDPVDVALTREFSSAAQPQLNAGGWVQSTDTTVPASGHKIRFYRATSPDGPWTLETTVESEKATDEEPAGRFLAALRDGFYRTTLNTTSAGVADRKIYTSQADGGSDFEHGTMRCMTRYGSFGFLDRLSITRTGGTVTGTVTDQRGKPINYPRVEVYESDDPAGENAKPVASVDGDYNGTYSVPVSAADVTLRFSQGHNPYNEQAERFPFPPEWLGDAPSLATAPRLSVPVGATSEGHDAIVGDPPIRPVVEPRIKGKVQYAEPLIGDSGAWSPMGATRYSVRWLRTRNGKTTAIAGATTLRYVPREADIGAQLSMRVTVSVPSTYPGIEPVVFTTKKTVTVKYAATLSVNAKVSGRKISASARVRYLGLSKQDGKVTFYWFQLKKKGKDLVPTGPERHKSVRYTKGATAKYAFKVPKSGYWAVVMVAPETSTRLEKSRGGYVVVK